MSDVKFNMAGSSQPENIGGLAVSPNFLPMMGVRPVMGRGFTADEEKAGAAPVVLLSYALWRSHFRCGSQGDRTNNSSGQPDRDNRWRAPPDFRWVEKCDVMEPMGVWATHNDSATDRGDRGDLLVAGRLAAGVRMEQARSEMVTIAEGLARAYPGANAQSGVNLRPLREAYSGTVRPAILNCWEPRSSCFWLPAQMWRICS